MTIIKKEDFFNSQNTLLSASAADYERAQFYIETAESFANTTYKPFFILDYYKKNFLYVANNPLFLCGYSREEVKGMGFDFFLQCTPKEEHNMLHEINEVAFEMFFKMGDDEARTCVVSYDYHLVHGSRRGLVSQQMTPLAFNQSGQLWLGLCVISLSHNKEPGNLVLKSDRRAMIYDFDRHIWNLLAPVQLSADEKSVIQLAAKGYTIEQIAEKMCKAVDTVKQCRRRLFAKLGVDNIAEAVVFAINNKLL